MAGFQFITRAVFDTSTLTGTYQTLNSTGFSGNIKSLKIYNAGTNGIDISYDGVTDHDYFPAGATIILDLQANHSTDSSNGMGILEGRKGQIIYGKGTAGTGNLYIIGYR
jgi:hypothetical protein